MKGIPMPINWPKRKGLSAKQVRVLAASLRLDLDNRRATKLRTMVKQLHGMSDLLADVELGETVPAAIFSPRWEE